MNRCNILKKDSYDVLTRVRHNKHFITKKLKRRCKKSKSINDLMDLKELCKKVDRIAILERCDSPNTSDKRLAIKKRTRPGNTTRLVLKLIL